MKLYNFKTSVVRIISLLYQFVLDSEILGEKELWFSTDQSMKMQFAQSIMMLF